MLFFIAFETKTISTFTLHNIFFSKVILFNDVITIFSWTPLDLSVVICELFAMPLQVLFFEIDFGVLTFIVLNVFYAFWKILQKERVWHHDIAFLLNTFGKDALCTLCPYFLL